ncbi:MULTISPECIES: class IIb bacteriocin, lactobin A/cerein 7B family [Streptococcus]|jgi:class IIb bacteriocin, lactobin A/cerein 7B family|uniref:class IIb bacteriocin, lactobin A/cerein 7B family n=1 Tax=Streptococcus TaxID=1301 RepID=UPI001BD6C7B5|nr:class IIb bacteriocin, lactobin A/cerein 7B family [Streptococcus oralis]MBS9401644.1 class IIb bacteriocin, lactobin A/cerein 7B family [Streptococcus oralis]MCY7087545.1 class IIb bacteriocin, lactobin A/cerein 7B family [Streptococcus oralis]MDB6209984.1 class IIb bacteriocin, lactobin A/cerein 7B family [Streptococcus oralis]
MTNFDKMEQNFAALTEEELTDVNGGIAPIVIGGVVISWKLIGGVAALATATAGAGVAAGYYANRP